MCFKYMCVDSFEINVCLKYVLNVFEMMIYKYVLIGFEMKM